MKRFIVLIYLTLLLGILPASEIEDKERNTINAAIDLLYQEKFEEALPIFEYIKDTYPDHPIGDFFLGFYYNFLASYYESDNFDSKIVLYYDLAEKKAKYHLSNNEKDPWFNFYMGASLVNKGYMLGRDGSRFSGLTKTFDGISYIEDCLEYDKFHGDALMLLANYKYYKSTALSWVYDRRDLAVLLLKQSITSSYFSEYLAKSTLGWIYIDYEKYSDAEIIADKALEKYPENHLFLFLKARAVFELKKYQEAAELYQKLETKISAMNPKYSEKDMFNIYYFLSKIYSAMNDPVKSRNYYEKAIMRRLTKKERDILRDRLDELAEANKLKSR
jgi:tetratricopeptide (TPR) repeat protein